MKTCDVCKRSNGNLKPVYADNQINSVFIGISINVARVGQENECPCSVELCIECLEKVNTFITKQISIHFGITIRK